MQPLPPEKGYPPFSQQPPLKPRSCQAPFCENLVGGSPPPPPLYSPCLPQKLSQVILASVFLPALQISIKSLDFVR